MRGRQNGYLKLSERTLHTVELNCLRPLSFGADFRFVRGIGWGEFCGTLDDGISTFDRPALLDSVTALGLTSGTGGEGSGGSSDRSADGYADFDRERWYEAGARALAGPGSGGRSSTFSLTFTIWGGVGAGAGSGGGGSLLGGSESAVLEQQLPMKYSRLGGIWGDERSRLQLISYVMYGTVYLFLTDFCREAFTKGLSPFSIQHKRRHITRQGKKKRSQGQGDPSCSDVK